MNKEKREKLKGAKQMLSDALKIVVKVQSEEQESLDCMPEGLQNGEGGINMQMAIDSMEEAIDHIDSANDKLLDAIE